MSRPQSLAIMLAKDAATVLVAFACLTPVLIAEQQVGTDPDTTVSQSQTTHTMPRWATRPCPEEDSVNCYWDAGTSGNHKGHSFMVRQFPGRRHMVCVMYVKPADARRWDYCEATR